jgi:hypothetical protein
MGRWKVFETRWLSCRLHELATEDIDRHFHDHPWPFVSIVLTGGYIEARPDSIEPDFTREGVEIESLTFRRAGNVALRRATDRHQITNVQFDTFTLFIYGQKQQWWGFYTPAGKVYWKDYPSCHAALAPGADRIEERT